MVNGNACRFLHFHPYSFSLYVLYSQFFALYVGHSVPFCALAATRAHHRNILVRRSDLGASPSCVLHTCAYARDVSQQFRMKFCIFNDVVGTSLSSTRACVRARERANTVRVNMKLVRLGDANSLFFYVAWRPRFVFYRFFTTCHSKPIFCLLIVLKEPIYEQCLFSFILIIY